MEHDPKDVAKDLNAFFPGTDANNLSASLSSVTMVEIVLSEMIPISGNAGILNTTEAHKVGSALQGLFPPRALN